MVFSLEKYEQSEYGQMMYPNGVPAGNWQHRCDGMEVVDCHVIGKDGREYAKYTDIGVIEVADEVVQP